MHRRGDQKGFGGGGALKSSRIMLVWNAVTLAKGNPVSVIVLIFLLDF